MNKTRTGHVVKNSWYGLFNKIITLFFSFAVRTIFIKKLGAEYLGVEGLFSNILSLLSLAELGVGNVLIFSLYKPIFDNDKKKINALLRFYKKLYFIIAAFVAIIGISIIPFLKYMVNSSFSYENVLKFYLIYLANSVISYIAVCWTTMIKAEQEQYIIYIISGIIKIITSIVQIVVLIIFGSFIGYLIITVISTLLQNIVASIVAKKRYKIEKSTDVITKEEKNSIFSNVKSTFLYKIGVVIVNATDNILISMLIGTIFVGYYSNYALIVNQFNSLIAIICTALIASIGSLSVQNNSDKACIVFNRLIFFFHVYSGICFVGFALVFNDVITLWIGKENVLGNGMALAIAFNYYIQNIINPVWMYREAYGLFNEIKYLVLVTSILNIVLSIIGGKLFGIVGIILATSLSRILTIVWYEPQLLYKKIFKNDVFEYFKKQFKYCILTALTFIICYFICRDLFVYNLIITIVTKIVIICMIFATIFIFFNKRSDELKYWISLLKQQVYKKRSNLEK